MAIVLESVDSLTTRIFSDRERDMIYKLRALLKDCDYPNVRTLNTLVENERGERWSDHLLLVYINQSIAMMNSSPPYTEYTLEQIPTHFDGFVLLGATIVSLCSEAILQVGEAFSYSDNGISLNIDLSGKYQALADSLRNAYNQQLKDIKTAMRARPAGIRSSPAPVRIRSYAPRMWVYR